MRSRAEIDVDEPSIDHLQALLLLAMANFQAGKGKKSYMLLSHAVSMAFALNLHRELPTQLKIAAIEREGRRKLFWTCYAMDRFTVAGSKRPRLISDESINLRLPAWQTPGTQIVADGNFFPNGTSMPYPSGVSSAGQSSGAMLVEAVRILGVANGYLAAGGVKSDSRFPWHAQSTLSKIRADLDHWAASTQDVFTSVEALFGQPDSSTLVLSKLIYHLVHCLIYRPFLPVDLNELSGTSQHQSWQIEATNLCFMHANAIVELVEIGKNMGIIYWPSFVGYCICTAGTVHIHGAHYASLQDGDVFANSGDCLTREMVQISDLRSIWSGVQHQRETLQAVYTSHLRLVQSLAHSPIRFSPVFQMEDFFDRYPGSYIDGAHITFADVISDASSSSQQGTLTREWRGGIPFATTSQRSSSIDHVSLPAAIVPSQSPTQRKIKRRKTEPAYPYPTPSGERNGDILEQHQPNENNEDYDACQTHMNGDHTKTQTLFENHTLNQGTESPLFPLSPVAQTIVLPNYDSAEGRGMLHHAQSEDLQSPSTVAFGVDSAHPDGEDDPFLNLLEHLATNDVSNANEYSDLDFYIHGQG